MSSYTPHSPLPMICQRSFFSFPFILISEFCCDTKLKPIPRDFANTCTLPPHRELESIILAARAREERLIPRCWDFMFNEYMNCCSIMLLSLCRSVCMSHRRLMCNCICMITRLCMQSQTNTFESYRSIKQHMYLYKYMLVLRTASVSNFRCAS